LALRSRSSELAEAEPLWDGLASATWACVCEQAVARSAPDPGAAEIARLAPTTILGSREVVSALERRLDGAGREWIRAGLPVRPNGTTGWIERSSLGALRRVRRAFVVDADRLRAQLLKGGDPVWEGPVALGKRGFETPRGTFFVRIRMIPPSSAGFYGRFVLWISATMPFDWMPGFGWVGIHGTNRPDLVPGFVSQGCIRLRNEDIAYLRDRLPIGAPVVIR
jgi:L,D-transpeptidase catalytic domain